MLRSPQDLYARLLSSTHGYPLWTPKPSNEFLIERPEGLRIGDVGIVTPDYGGFDALFNLCLPRNHRFHTRYGVPDSFTCIRPEELEIWTDFSAEPHGQVILTPSVTRVGAAHSSTEAPHRDDSGVSAYQFKLSSDEGALLILPEGAELHELLNDGLFIEKASQNGAEWYDYAVNRRRRIICKDALYVITGLYKTRSWSVAAFENVAGSESYPAHYKHIPDRGSIASMYGWETTRASLHSRSGTSIDYVAPNQTVFIRGLKISLRNRFLGSTRISVKADTPSKARSNPVRLLGVVPGNSRVRDGFASLRRKEGGSTSRTTIHTGRSTEAAEEQAENNISDDGHEGAHVEIQRIPNIPPVFHPSNAINRYLLRKSPSANIAISRDSIWMSILEDKSVTTEDFDDDLRLEKVLSQNYDVVSYRGVVRLERKGSTIVDRQTPSSQISNTTKDLSHVPCKFFKVGACTAGSSCPFSHAVHKPGQQKGVCAHFVKGNCRFGDKCVFAHILPTQTMSMDRKNEKVAQVAIDAEISDAESEDTKSSEVRKTSSHPLALLHDSSSISSARNSRKEFLSDLIAPALPTSAGPPMSIPLKPIPFLFPNDPDNEHPAITKAEPADKQTELTRRIKSPSLNSLPEASSIVHAPNSALGHTSYVSVPRNPKDVDNQDLLMKSRVTNADSRLERKKVALVDRQTRSLLSIDEPEGRFDQMLRISAPENTKDAESRLERKEGTFVDRETNSRISTSRASEEVDAAAGVGPTVTRLLIASRQFLESLRMWSNLQLTEKQISDVYVRLGNDFNATVAAFAAFEIDMSDLMSIPEDLRNVLETCLAEDATPNNLAVHMPTIRAIITRLLQGLRTKQSLYRRIISDQEQHQNQDRDAEFTVGKTSC